MDEREIIQKTLDEHPGLDPALRTLLQDKLAPASLTTAEEDDEEILVLCGYWPSVINGSKLVLCAECKTRCCIAPSTQQSLVGRTGKVRMLCIACFEKNPPEEAAEMLELLKAAKKASTFNPFAAHK